MAVRRRYSSNSNSSLPAKSIIVYAVNPDFRFGELLDNLLTSPDAFIHAGFNHMKTLRMATPNR